MYRQTTTEGPNCHFETRYRAGDRPKQKKAFTESDSELLMPTQKSQEKRIAELDVYKDRAMIAIERMKALW